jgi:FkbH-like protein
MSNVITHLHSAHQLLAPLLTRERITRSPTAVISRTYKVRVDRTMPFELIGHLLAPFCELWGAEVVFDYSDYDASLSQLGGLHQSDAYMLWLDWRIYHQSMGMEVAVDWLIGRIRALREATAAPIWINNWPERLALGDTLFGLRVNDRGQIRKFNQYLYACIESIAGCEFIDLAGIAYEEEVVYDLRNDEISSYPFSDSITIRLARHLGTQLIPATFLPRIKAIAIDLDDTLYRGILAEDGWSRLNVSEGHLELQKLLLRLKNSGILLAICSRNEEQDVRLLFDNRDDFPLGWSDFTIIYANWSPKADNLQQIAQQLNIDTSAMLFIDDNPAQLLHVGEAIPTINLLQAEISGMDTAVKLSYYPGLYQIRPDPEAALRTKDIQANQIRTSLKENSSEASSYLASLQMIVTIYLNQASHAGRLYDLSSKTNQFNLALRRMTVMESHSVMNKEQYVTLTIRLSDIVSDSGIIGAFVCRLVGQHAHVVEAVFSCRALGRDIESVSFACLLEQLSLRGIEHISFDVKDGPRNAPAIEWLKRYIQGVPVHIPLEELRKDVNAVCKQHPSKVEVID